MSNSKKNLIGGCIIGLLLALYLVSCTANFVKSVKQSDADREAKAAKVPAYTRDFDNLAAQVQRSEKKVLSVNDYANTLGASEPFGPGLTIHLKQGATCDDARKIGQRYYQKLVAIRLKYLSDSEARSGYVDVNNERGRGMVAVSVDGIEETGCRGGGI